MTNCKIGPSSLKSGPGNNSYDDLVYLILKSRVRYSIKVANRRYANGLLPRHGHMIDSLFCHAENVEIGTG